MHDKSPTGARYTLPVISPVATIGQRSSRFRFIPRDATANFRSPFLFLAVSVFAFGYLYLQLFYAGVPILLSGDQVYFWTNAQRMLHGERIYLDFFQFTPPGTDLVYLALFRVLGVRLWITNLVVLLLGMALVWVCFSISMRLMSGRAALLASALFLVVIYSRLLNGTHHLFSMLLVLCAVRVLMASSSPTRVAVSGAILGVAAFFTHVHGVASLLAVTLFLLWEPLQARLRWREFAFKCLFLLVSFATVVIVLNLPFAIRSGLHRLWDLQVRHVWEFMTNQALPWMGLPGPPTLRSLPIFGQYAFVYLSLPLVYALVLLRSVATRSKTATPHQRELFLLSLVGTFLLAEVAISPNWLRIYAVSAPGIILLAWAAESSRSRRYAVPLLWLMVLCVAFQQTWSRVQRQYRIVDLPAGKVAVPPAAQEKLEWLAQHTVPGEYFFQAGWPGVYVPLELKSAVFLDVVETTGITPAPYIERTILELDAKQVRMVLWAAHLNREGPGADTVAPLRTYIRTHYRQIQLFQDGDELWERAP